MDNCVFPVVFKACACQSLHNGLEGNQIINLGWEQNSQFTLSDTTSQSFAPLTYPPLELPIDPSLTSTVDSEPSTTDNLPAKEYSEEDTGPKLLAQRLEKLERAVELLQDPTHLQHQYQDLSRLEDLEKLTGEFQSKLEHLQQAITSLEAWAEQMNVVYNEFKAGMHEIYKLVNSRQHLSKLLQSEIPSSREPSVHGQQFS